MKKNMKFLAMAMVGVTTLLSTTQGKSEGSASEAITEQDYNDTFRQIAKARKRDASVTFSTAKRVPFSMAGKAEFDKFKGKSWKELVADRKTRTNDDETKTLALLWK